MAGIVTFVNVYGIVYDTVYEAVVEQEPRDKSDHSERAGRSAISGAGMRNPGKQGSYLFDLSKGGELWPHHPRIAGLD